MNKSKKLYIFQIVLFSLFALGLSVLLVISLNNRGGLFGLRFGQTGVSSNLIIDKEYSFEELNKVEIKIKAGELKIVNTKSTDDKASLKFYAEHDEFAHIDKDDDSLKIEDRSSNCYFFCVNQTSVKVELTLPENYAGELVIDISYGDVEINEFKLASLYLNSSAGNVKIESTKNINASLNMGNLELGDCFGEAIINSSMSSIKISELHLTKDSKIDLSMGSVEINHVGDVRVEADTSLGEIDIEGDNKNSNIVLKIDNSMGSITVR
ncbi:MAG: DUF4097 family beta strand repeat-containing protein [Candidatus Saccharibacteria bacterium]|nr:DUF4097 family beta strand repeat-containing protein [Candidatus Saccharibacteria bacterium]